MELAGGPGVPEETHLSKALPVFGFGTRTLTRLFWKGNAPPPAASAVCSVFNHLVVTQVINSQCCDGDREAFKLRGSPKAPPTTLLSKGKKGTEGNDLTRVISVEILERGMGNPQPSPSGNSWLR